jgi:hypothetical protein
MNERAPAEITRDVLWYSTRAVTRKIQTDRALYLLEQ